jgi:hypothetical protein
MSFNGNEGSAITLAEAAELTANYRATISPGDQLGLFVGRNHLLAILNQSGCMGVRMYYGINKYGEKQLVLVGAASNENDMEKGIIVDRLRPCPTHCSSSNPLNS